MGRISLLCPQIRFHSDIYLEGDAGSRASGGPGNPHGYLNRHYFTWERETAYRRALCRIARSPETKIIEQREFDDESRVLRVLISGKLHAFLVEQLQLFPEPIRAITGTRAYRRIAASEEELTERYAGCDPRCTLLDTLDFGFTASATVPALLAIHADRLIACRLEEVQLGSGFVADRDRINAELMAAKTKK
jgi:hypothetical protein